MCELFDLHPFEGPTPFNRLTNITLKGQQCDKNTTLYPQPEVHCLRGAHLSFDTVSNITITGITFNKCGLGSMDIAYTDVSIQTRATLGFYQCHNVDLSNTTVTRSRGVGLAFYNTFGLVVIGPGAVVTWCKDTGVVLDFENHTTSDAGLGARYSITGSDIRFNQAAKNGTTLGRGGGIAAIFRHNASHHKVDIWSSRIAVNVASTGGGIFTGFYDFAYNNSVFVSLSSLIANHVGVQQICLSSTADIESVPELLGGCDSAQHSSHNVPLGNSFTDIMDMCQDDSSVGFQNSCGKGGSLAAVFHGSTRRNTVGTRGQLTLLSNVAVAGGGVFAAFYKESARNWVYLRDSSILHNTVRQTVIPGQGGGGGVRLEDMSRARNTFILRFSRVNWNSNWVGGGVSIVKGGHPTKTEDITIIIREVLFDRNNAQYGLALSVETLEYAHQRHSYAKKHVFVSTALFQSDPNGLDWFSQAFKDNFRLNRTVLLEQARKSRNGYRQRAREAEMQGPLFRHSYAPPLVYLKSAKVYFRETSFTCGLASQGVMAVNSEIVASRRQNFVACVATYGGAIALYEGSIIRVTLGTNVTMVENYALQRGGAVYVDSRPGPATTYQSCFIQLYDDPSVPFFYWGSINFHISCNVALLEGPDIYANEVGGCFRYPAASFQDFNTKDLAAIGCTPDGGHAYVTCLFPNIVAGPSSVSGFNSSGSSVLDGNSLLLLQFIPGKETQLPFGTVKDELGNIVHTIFTVQVQIGASNYSVIVHPFSRYTSNFRVILNGLPYGSLTYSLLNKTSAVHPQLVLQSVDNTEMVLKVDIELLCCPPGYILVHAKEEGAQCQCASIASSMTAISGCNDNTTQAELIENSWVGYLPAADGSSCDGKKLFSAPCPVGYCSEFPTALPSNSSREALESLLCGPNKRKGILCGECQEGHSMTVNFGDLSAVCVDCSTHLSSVGMLIWIMSEWIPLTVMLAIVLLFNIDLLSGHLNSFLLFAQILHSSRSLGSGTVRNPTGAWGAFVKIYRCLYGIWNLDFLGVFLPSYCLTRTAHLTTLQVLLLQYTVGLFPLLVVAVLVILEKGSEKRACCLPVTRCLKRIRKLTAKVSNSKPTYDRALAAFVIVGFTRFLVTSSYILVRQTIVSPDGEMRAVVWWQGNINYGSLVHFAYLIPSVVILAVFVLLPTLVLLAFPLIPHVHWWLRSCRFRPVSYFGHLRVTRYCCTDMFTGRWMWHFIHVFQGCYRDRFRFFAALLLIYRIIQLALLIFISDVATESAFRLQLVLCVGYLLLHSICQPYKRKLFNVLDTLFMGNMALIILLNLQRINSTPGSGVRIFYQLIELVLIYLPLIYFFGLVVVKLDERYKIRDKLKALRKPSDPQEDTESMVEVDNSGLGTFASIYVLHPPSTIEECNIDDEDDDQDTTSA